MGQKVANAPLGSFSVKTVFTDTSEAIQEISVGAILSVRIDEGATYNYYGWALPGTAEGDAQWRIARWTVANVQKLLWADGDVSFDNIWTNRASLSYS